MKRGAVSVCLLRRTATRETSWFACRVTQSASGTNTVPVLASAAQWMRPSPVGPPRLPEDQACRLTPPTDAVS